MSPQMSNIYVNDPWGLSEVPITILKSVWLKISQPTNSSVTALEGHCKIAAGPAGRSKPNLRSEMVWLESVTTLKCKQSPRSSQDIPTELSTLVSIFPWRRFPRHYLLSCIAPRTAFISEGSGCWWDWLVWIQKNEVRRSVGEANHNKYQGKSNCQERSPDTSVFAGLGRGHCLVSKSSIFCLTLVSPAFSLYLLC